MCLSIIKELTAKWLEGLYDGLRASDKIIVNRFKEAGIKEAIENLPTCVPGDSDGDPFAECD